MSNTNHQYFKQTLTKRNQRSFDFDMDLGNINPLTSHFFNGNSGTGKTTIAIQIAKQWMSKTNSNSLRFIKFNEILNIARLSNRSDEEGWQNRQSLQYLKEVELLIIDDLGTEKQTAFVDDLVYQIIDFRYENELQTVITSNYSTAQIKEIYHERIADRISGMCECLELSGESYRISETKVSTSVGEQADMPTIELTRDEKEVLIKQRNSSFWSGYLETYQHRADKEQRIIDVLTRKIQNAEPMQFNFLKTI